MRLAMVVQRYGLDVNGGAELHARTVAEHLAPYVQVEVVTTCARDYLTWADYYPAGLTWVNDVPVRRFSVPVPRNIEKFGRTSNRTASSQRSIYDEMRWMEAQGPNSPDLFHFIRQNQNRYDLFLFFTYLYATTFMGLPWVAHKSILCPTAHHEPWLKYSIFHSLFRLPRGFIFLTPEEARLVRRQFQNDYIPGLIIGSGIDIPRANHDANVAAWDYVLYLGRVDESKGCKELIDYFLRYKSAASDPVKLVLIGTKVMKVPDHPDILALGYLSDEDRYRWLQQASLLIMPSEYESLSLSTLEAWARGVPALVNGRSEVLKGHCRRGHGGLYYENEAEFLYALRLLRVDAELRLQLGRQGRAYVEQNYSWQQVIEAHLKFLREVFDRVYDPRREP